MKKIRIDDALREEVQYSDKTLTAIAEESGIHLSSLWRFVHKKGGLNLTSAANIADTLGVELAKVRVMREPTSISGRMRQIAPGAQNHIGVIGGVSGYDRDLAAIEAAVRQRRLTYRHLITGDCIDRELHDHLKALIGLDRVTIRKAERVYFPDLMVTDRDAFILLPMPGESDSYGLQLRGSAYTTRLSDYFLRIWDAHSRERDQVRDQRALGQLLECKRED